MAKKKNKTVVDKVTAPVIRVSSSLVKSFTTELLFVSWFELLQLGMTGLILAKVFNLV